MRDQHQIASSLLRNAIARGLSRDSAVRVVKSVLGEFDKPTYSANEEQILLDRTRDACVLAKFDGLAGIVRRESTDVVRSGGAAVNARPSAALRRGIVQGSTEAQKKPVPPLKTSNLAASNEVTITKRTPNAFELRVIGRGRA